MLKSNIAELLKKSPYKREHIQKKLNISANTLSNWARGNTKPNAEDLFRLAKVLGVKVDDLYEYDE
ncbi:helix-turn-helix transcriptional regulator [Metabacillus dongyingensis]|uniref:helix-turn-helix domain-containing protein n=1 Tax=Metabacillus dongyingensis TaxID=2874282 RepID=UPI003B8D97EB